MGWIKECVLHMASASTSAAPEHVGMNEDTVEGFLNSGRTGRRNALPDILDEQYAATGTGDLPMDMERLSCTDQAGTSSSTDKNQPSTSTAAN
ncbi:cAMP-dependent protein kinase inhibitor beta [Galendromus occidentalis]|uniref:cAMP-dependent protein kinase inhibitor beta n=1 Tax=Galendromus occidentalis TaxID=34638 RepID=A0AAJ6QN59_9ACAR|nr:cAMP-dependent protein kinase inhibitor beta [Galendromus occidentalis]